MRSKKNKILEILLLLVSKQHITTMRKYYKRSCTQFHSTHSLTLLADKKGPHFPFKTLKSLNEYKCELELFSSPPRRYVDVQAEWRKYFLFSRPNQNSMFCIYNKTRLFLCLFDFTTTKLVGWLSLHFQREIGSTYFHACRREKDKNVVVVVRVIFAPPCLPFPTHQP